MTVLRARAVLFDMDGTLVDSNEVVEAMWTEFAHALGVDAAEVIDFAHGRPSRSTIARYAPHDVATWEEHIHRGEAERFLDLHPIVGAVDVVAAIPAERWAVVTSAIRQPALERLASVGFPQPAVLIGADDVAHGKPDPEGYARAARELGFEPADCVVFEDTSAGIAAGLAAGCQAVVVGGAVADVMEGLPRIADFTGVSVRAAGDGLEFTLP